MGTERAPDKRKDLLGLLRPDLYAPSLETIDLDALEARGIRALLLDRDRTLTAWRSRDVDSARREWVAAANERFSLCILSNTIFIGGVSAVGASLGIPVVVRWGLGRKPFPGGFRAALRMIGVDANEAAMIGDQLFTDIAGGNLQGLFTVLVEPVGEAEFPSTQLLRPLERMLLRRWGIDPDGHVAEDSRS